MAEKENLTILTSNIDPKKHEWLDSTQGNLELCQNLIKETTFAIESGNFSRKGLTKLFTQHINAKIQLAFIESNLNPTDETHDNLAGTLRLFVLDGQAAYANKMLTEKQKLSLENKTIETQGAVMGWMMIVNHLDYQNLENDYKQMKERISSFNRKKIIYY